MTKAKNADGSRTSRRKFLSGAAVAGAAVADTAQGAGARSAAPASVEAARPSSSGGFDPGRSGPVGSYGRAITTADSTGSSAPSASG